MSSSDAQPPLTRRQARERERAGETGALPVVPPSSVPSSDAPSLTAPSSEEPSSSAQEPSSGGSDAGRGGADASGGVEQSRRRPGSHAAPLRPAPASAVSQAPATRTPAAAPSPAEPPAQPPIASAPPASATEIVPGTGMTRRQLRAYRAAQDQAVRPVPLQTPTPQSSDRTVADVLDTVAAVEGQQHPAAEPTAVDPAVVEQATAADNAPDAVEPLAEAAEHGEEPRRRRSTWAPHVAGAEAVPEAESSTADVPVVPAPASAEGVAPAAGPVAAGTSRDAGASPAAGVPGDAAAPADARGSSVSAVPADSAVPSGSAVPSSAVGADSQGATSFRLPLPSELPSPKEPGVFPLDLDGDTNEVPVQSAPENPSSSASPVAPSSRDAASPAASSGDGASFGVAASSAAAAASSSAAAASAGPRTASTDDDSPVATTPQVTRPIEPKPMTTAFDAPVGHWSRQGEAVDEGIHESETGIRRVTDTSTGALILPNSALGDVTGALNATGEVILTGSIDLPKSLSSTGSHRPIDGAEVDRLLDQHDEQPETDASPVRASRAVSSHTSTRQVVLAAAKPKQSRGPLVLAWSAASVGVVAAAAIVYALVGIH